MFVASAEQKEAYSNYLLPIERPHLERHRDHLPRHLLSAGDTKQHSVLTGCCFEEVCTVHLGRTALGTD